MSKGEKPILSVRIDADLLERVDRLAAEADVGRAEIVERCLRLGLGNQEELVEWLKTPVQGHITQLLTHPLLLTALKTFVGELDETSLKIREGAIKSRKKGKARPATE